MFSAAVELGARVAEGNFKIVLSADLEGLRRIERKGLVPLAPGDTELLTGLLRLAVLMGVGLIERNGLWAPLEVGVEVSVKKTVALLIELAKEF